MSDKPIAAISTAANFGPDDAPPGIIEWTFSVTKEHAVGAGLYELRFVRTLTREERGDLRATLVEADRAASDTRSDHSPALLEALKEAREALSKVVSDGPDLSWSITDTLTDINAAISQAEGGE